MELYYRLNSLPGKCYISYFTPPRTKVKEDLRRYRKEGKFLGEDFDTYTFNDVQASSKVLNFITWSTVVAWLIAMLTLGAIGFQVGGIINLLMALALQHDQQKAKKFNESEFIFDTQD